MALALALPELSSSHWGLISLLDDDPTPVMAFEARLSKAMSSQRQR